ncbi:hypothetical protein D3C72_960380 [compost metagenome]
MNVVADCNGCPGAADNLTITSDQTALLHRMARNLVTRGDISARLRIKTFGHLPHDNIIQGNGDIVGRIED